MSGKISDQTYEEWNRSTGTKELPERLHPLSDAKGKRKSTGKKKATARKERTTRKRTTKKR